jgi:hypothetical protein
MPEDLYDDSPSAPAPAAADGQKTCLLPKSAFPEASVGSEICVEVVRVHEQEIEVIPKGKAEKDESQEQSEAAPAPSDGGGLRSMLED